jgi:serine O-acetyltransferase
MRSAPPARATHVPEAGAATPGLLRTICIDLKNKALWIYESDRARALAKVLLTDGTSAMVLYRLMQWSRRYRLSPLEMAFNKMNAVFCNCIIGRGAEFGPGLVLIHSTGIVINARVRAGRNVHIEHQVTIGAERRASPVIGDDVFIGAGAKLIGAVTVGEGARIGANAVVVQDVAAHTTVVGIPARVVRQRPQGGGLDAPEPAGGVPNTEFRGKWDMGERTGSGNGTEGN